MGLDRRCWLNTKEISQKISLKAIMSYSSNCLLLSPYLTLSGTSITIRTLICPISRQSGHMSGLLSVGPPNTLLQFWRIVEAKNWTYSLVLVIALNIVAGKTSSPFKACRVVSPLLPTSMSCRLHGLVFFILQFS